MISHHTSLKLHSPGATSKCFRDTTASRSGEWVIHTWDRVQIEGQCCLASCIGGTTSELIRTSVVLREKEIDRLFHLFMHGVRNGTKMSTIHANMEQAAQTFWPTGSMEHISMRLLAVVVVIRYLSGHDLVEPGICCCVKKKHKTDLRRRFEKKSGTTVGVQASLTDPLEPTVKKAPRVTASATAPKSSSPETPDSMPTLAQFLIEGGETLDKLVTVDEFIAGAEDDASSFGGGDMADWISDGCWSEPLSEVDEVDVWEHMHGGNTPLDAEIIAGAHFRAEFMGRLMTYERVIEGKDTKVHMVVGQEFVKDPKLGDTQQLVGTILMPIPIPPLIYKNGPSNCVAAKVERMDKKFREFKPSNKSIKKLRRLIGEATGTNPRLAIWSVKNVQNWAEENLHLSELVSGKWSAERTVASIENMLSKTYPEMQFKMSIKAECMPDGKAPRLLIADGDDGQLMALLVVKCFEDLLFHWYENKSIKHIGKRDAIFRAVKNLTKKGARLIEGDGSAWDTTCSKGIRDLTENPVMRHIMQVLIPYGVVPEQWHAEHDACNDKKELKLFFDGKVEKMRMKINSIRRSGQRGTSCLNWWVNFCNWVCSVMEEPWLFLDPKKRTDKDVTGQKRWWNGCFEGDDSLCAMHPPMIEGDELSKRFLKYWEEMGFNMKIVFAKERAEFCGWHIVCEDGEPTGFAAPDLVRNIKHAGVSVSGEAKRAALDGNMRVLHDCAASKALAYAYNFAGLYPSVSRKFHSYAVKMRRSTEIKDRDMSMICYGEDGHGFTEAEQLIEGLNLAVTPTEELGRLESTGVKASVKELEAFTLYDWDFEQLDDLYGYRASLPEAWRPTL